MIIEISTAIIAIAFVILVIYLIMTMKAVRVTLRQINHTLVDGRAQIAELAIEAKKAIKHGDQLSLDIDEKINAFSPLFRTIKKLGNMLEGNPSSFDSPIVEKIHNVAQSVRSGLNDTHTFSKKLDDSNESEVTNSVKILEDVLKVTAIGIRLWQNIKKRR